MSVSTFFVYAFAAPAPTTTTTSTATAQETLWQTDITEVGMNMYTTAYNWEVGSFSGYTADAFRGIAKKLNASLKDKENGMPVLVQKCGWCATIVDNWFDAALTKYYRETPPKMTTDEEAFFSVVNPYLHPKIRNADLGSAVRRELNNRIKNMVAGITEQTREQMDAYRDIAGMGLYYDGDRENSPYDLLDDIRRIDEIFFRDAPAYGDYKNTSKQDSEALITGQLRQASWVSTGENYDLNLLGDVKKALWEQNNNWSAGTASGWSNQATGDCASWYCVTIDFVQSSHYFLGWNSGWAWSAWANARATSAGKNSFQGIFEEGLEWITKNGDKRNFACKAAPAINFYETENDMNLSLSKIFSGLGIYYFWKTPQFLAGFLGRNDNTNDTDKAEWKKWKQSQEDKRTEDALRDEFRANGLDYERPTNVKWSTDRAFTNAGIENGSINYQKSSDIVESVKRSQEYYQQLLKENGAWSNRALMHEANKDSIKHIEKTFDDLATRARLVRQFSEDLNKMLKYLREKPDCTN